MNERFHLRTTDMGDWHYQFAAGVPLCKPEYPPAVEGRWAIKCYRAVNTPPGAVFTLVNLSMKKDGEEPEKVSPKTWVDSVNGAYVFRNSYSGGPRVIAFAELMRRPTVYAHVR